jgi:hypothetical protein
MLCRINAAEYVGEITYLNALTRTKCVALNMGESIELADGQKVVTEPLRHGSGATCFDWL